MGKKYLHGFSLVHGFGWFLMRVYTKWLLLTSRLQQKVCNYRESSLFLQIYYRISPLFNTRAQVAQLWEPLKRSTSKHWLDLNVLFSLQHCQHSISQEGFHLQDGSQSVKVQQLHLVPLTFVSMATLSIKKYNQHTWLSMQCYSC